MSYDSSDSISEKADILNLKKKLFQKSVIQHIKKTNWQKGAAAPWVVELDPTSACNLSCPDCISLNLLNQGGFTRSRLKKLAEEFVEAGVKAVVLIGGGEPLAHPEAWNIIEYLSLNGVKVGITTNGTLINRKMDILVEHTSWLRVSVDSGTADTFKIFRPDPQGHSQFDKVIENMRLFAKHKIGKLGYSFLILTEADEKGRIIRSNIDEIAQAAALAKDIGCDYFEVKPCFDMNHFLVSQPEKLMHDAILQINQARELGDENFKILTATNMMNVLNCEENIQPKEYTDCKIAQLRTLVTPSGGYVCPYFRGVDKKNLGDLHDQSFQDMWQGEQRKKVMEKLNPSRDCRFHCIRHESNQIINDMVEKISMGDDLSYETVMNFDPFI
jgi:MoaA/NifB/PqqE/SkfB family radical SAM enzyme